MLYLPSNISEISVTLMNEGHNLSISFTWPKILSDEESFMKELEVEKW
jgi:hypothetical protein